MHVLCIYYVCYASSIYNLCKVSCLYLCIYYVYSMCIVRSHFRSRFASCSLLGVQNSCVGPAAMSHLPEMIRIGQPKYNYMYTYVGNMTYKCRRGSDWCDIGEVLWLMKENNCWYAFDAPPDPVPTAVQHDTVIFETADADAHQPGWHTWTMTKSNHDEGRFQTFLISIN